MRKSVIIILSLMTVIIISACTSSNGDSIPTSGKDSSSEKKANFPQDKVEIIVPFGAGDTMDLAAHALAKEFKEITGQTLVVNNQPGGAGVPGTMKLIKSKSDGYTIGMIPSGQLVVRPLTQEVGYKLEDFTAILGVGDFQMHPVAAGDAPYDTVKEMVDYYANTDETLKIGTPGVNTYSHIFAELVANETGLEYNHLPFDGGPAVVAQILGGHVDVGVINVSNVAADVESGKLKILGFPSEERFENYPDVPTVKEQGINVVGGPTFGIYGPADMPEDIVEALNEIFNEAMESDGFKKFSTTNHILLTNTAPDVMMEQIKLEYESIKEVIK